jgi:hypothetical protein
VAQLLRKSTDTRSEDERTERRPRADVHYPEKVFVAEDEPVRVRVAATA